MSIFRLMLIMAFCLLLCSGISIGDVLGGRPSSSVCANAVDMGTWCGKGIEERNVVTGNTATFLPRVAAQQKIVDLAKQRIKGSYSYFIKTGCPDVAGLLDAAGSQGLIWTNDAHFLLWCNLPLDFFQENSCENLQYVLLSNDWQNLKTSLTNMVWTKEEVKWWFRDIVDGWNDGVFAGWWESSVNIRPPYEYSKKDLDVWRNLFGGTVANARGSATTQSDPATWGKDHNGAPDRFEDVRQSLFKSFVSPNTGNGFTWAHPMTGYAVATNPKELVWLANHPHISSTSSIYGGTNSITISSNYNYSWYFTNSITYGGDICDSNSFTTEVYTGIYDEVTDYTYATNGVTASYYVTNIQYQIAVNVTNVLASTNITPNLESGFGTTFFGSWWGDALTNIITSSRVDATNIWRSYTTNVQGPDVPVILAVANIETVTNITASTNYSMVYDPNLAVTNWYFEWTNTFSGMHTNSILVSTGIVATTTNMSNKLAAGITSIASVPYVGLIQSDLEFWPHDIGVERVVEFYIKAIVPTNIPLSGYSNINLSVYGSSADYNLFGGGHFKPPQLNQWCFWDATTSRNDIVDARVIGGKTVNDGSGYDWGWMTEEYMTNSTFPNLGYFFNQLAPGQQEEVKYSGWEVTESISIIKWNGPNGFRFK